jgi:PAS domain-containing protein
MRGRAPACARSSPAVRPSRRHRHRSRRRSRRARAGPRPERGGRRRRHVGQCRGIGQQVAQFWFEEARPRRLDAAPGEQPGEDIGDAFELRQRLGAAEARGIEPSRHGRPSADRVTPRKERAGRRLMGDGVACRGAFVNCARCFWVCRGQVRAAIGRYEGAGSRGLSHRSDRNRRLLQSVTREMGHCFMQGVPSQKQPPILVFQAYRRVEDRVIFLSMLDFHKLADAQTLAQAIVNTIPEPFVVLDAHFRVLAASASFYRNFKVEPEQTRGRLLYSLGTGSGTFPRCASCWRRSSRSKPRWTASRSSMIFPESAAGPCC